MLARRRMVGRPIARMGAAAVGTAVVVGTAGVVRHSQQKRYAQQDAAAQQQYNQAYQQGIADAQAQQVAAPPVQYVEQAPAPDMMAQLQQLTQLHEAGALTDAEFAAAKAKLLG